ncbi:DUF1853 family protein [Pseudoduganella buxea]|uniref:DUF1853 family protein n=1 Tax=Pseudoduganella buxea TaxID=1949069 RepID=A0A6I3T734_9BURK|nr:DUF1853 family protein [Pseudoduganella buxea]MTV56182.1 DUF1853 family protein [Pseudoduganella buxea]GGC25040.1 hypothetical protein GCM10011572_53080 [Pseudoduganella buxea]
MPAGAESSFDEGYQAGFARRWGHLTRPAVRALAWLLESPDLLDPAGHEWQGSIATLGTVDDATAAWLASLEVDPAPLDAALGERPYSRLGLYAEKLMAFYFAQRGDLVAHGLQVRAARNDTVGEFDFLLADGEGLRHIEFATKFYLLDSVDDNDPVDFDLLVGPNLADTLGRKMRKIFSQQLALSRHPAAQALLDRPVLAAQALVKGWLFYPPGPAPRLPGIGPRHCRGHWHAVSSLAAAGGEQFVVMPRLQWLAPLQVPAQPGADGAMAPTPPPLTRDALAALLRHKFETDRAPVMVAAVRREGDWLVEQSRAFVVPDEWPALAAQRRLEKRL